jgi:hypothetical protein
MPEDKAIAVIQRELSLPCPRCSAVVEVTVPLGRLLWQTKVKEVEHSVRDVLAARVEQRAQRARHKKRSGGQDAPADGSQPSSSGANASDDEQKETKETKMEQPVNADSIGWQGGSHWTVAGCRHGCEVVWVGFFVIFVRFCKTRGE